MRAVLCRTLDGIDGLAVADIPPPSLPSGGIRVAVHAAGISFANLLVIRGQHQNRAEPPFVPGTEIAGIVTEVAPDAAEGPRVGDRVCAGVTHGGFAEQAVVPAGNAFRIPDSIDFAAATQFPTIYATAYAALTWRAALQPGESLLVHGAAGASGLAAVEIGRALGARVIATAGGAKKCSVAKAHGADHAIDYTTEDFRQIVLALTDGGGADVVFDPVGGEVFDKSLRCVAPLARLITMGFASGRIPQIPANLLLVKNLTVIGLYWGFYMGWGRSRAGAALRAKLPALYEQLFRWTAEGVLRPVIDARLPLAAFADGLRRIENRSVIGKIVLLPQE